MRQAGSVDATLNPYRAGTVPEFLAMVSARVSHLQVSLGLANHASILRSSLPGPGL
jgi:hypothetical protein